VGFGLQSNELSEAHGGYQQLQGKSHMAMAREVHVRAPSFKSVVWRYLDTRWAAKMTTHGLYNILRIGTGTS